MVVIFLCGREWGPRYRFCQEFALNMALPLVLHEHKTHWARYVRPRAKSWGVRMIETRTAEALLRQFDACPVGLGVLDLTTNLEATLGALASADSIDDWLVLALNPISSPDLDWVARECGAALVLAGTVTPPRVLSILERWVPLASARSKALGWSARDTSDESDWITSLLEPPRQPRSSALTNTRG